MATIDNTKGGNTVLQNADSRNHYVIENVVDFTEVVATTADDVDVLNIPAGTIVRAVVVETLVEEGSALTYDVGEFGGDVDGWVVGADANAAGLTLGAGALSVFPGKLYVNAAVLSLNNLSANPAAASVAVRAVCEDVS
jgi:hypothetical protein